MTALSGNNEFCFTLTLNVLRGEGKQVLVNSSYLAPYVSMDRLWRIQKVKKIEKKKKKPHTQNTKQNKQTNKTEQKTFTYFSTDALEVSSRHGI